MDRIHTVAFYVYGDINGLALEVAVRAVPTGLVLSERYGNLTTDELLACVDATLNLAQPGDQWVTGAIQPPLWR